MRSIQKLLLGFTLSCLVAPSITIAETLFTIGSSDNSHSEFALAPAAFGDFANDGFFVVGKSEPRRDWPYVHPGPDDNWAGSRRHTYTILFGLTSGVAEGTARLALDLIDNQAKQPPRVEVTINGTRFERRLPPGAGDASVHGDASKGREFVWKIDFPSALLHTGQNEISITTMSGSWMIYDSLSLEIPGKAVLSEVPASTTILNAEAASVWMKDGDTQCQPATLVIRHIGQDIPAAVQVDGKHVAKFHLRNGVQTIEAKLPTSEEPRSVEFLLVEAKGSQKLASITSKVVPPSVREMWILPHSHVDIGYTHKQSDIIDVQISNLRTAMRLARKTATNSPGMRFKWNPEAIWSLDHFLQRASEEEKERFISAVKNGEVGVDALYGNLLTGLCRPEELVQGLAFAARLSNLTGVPVRSASICDVPGWTWGTVPIMAQAGVKYFAIGPNFGDRVGTIHLWDNKPFYWKSQSGNERLLCWVVDNYHFNGDLEHHVLAQTRRLQETSFPYDTSFMFWVGRGPGGAVDNAPPDEQITQKVVAWNTKYAAPKVVIGLAGDYFAKFESKYGSRLPEFSGDLTPYWEDGAGSTSRETALNRRSADRLSQAETLQTLIGNNSVQQADWDAAWKNVLLYTEHTWGAWCSISRPDDPFTLDQWRVKQAFALDADKQSKELLSASLAASTGTTTKEIAVWNTTQYKRSDIAFVPASAGAVSIQDLKGRNIPVQKLSSGDLAFIAEDVPAFGSKIYRLSSKPAYAKGSAKAQGTFISNDRMSLELDRTSGAIQSLKLVGSPHEFVDSSAPVGLNDFRYVLGTNSQGALKNAPVKIRTLEPGPVIAVLRIESEAPGCNKLTRDVRVIHGLDRVELVDSVDRKSVREKDAVHFGFGFRVPEGKIRMETPWAVVRPNEDQLPGSCRNWFTVQRWVDISNDKTGVTWAPIDAPLLQIGGMTANLLGSVEFHKWMTNALESQTIYSWAQNNHWHTNYKIDQPGVTTFEYILRPHQGGYSAAQSARFGMETSRPLIVAPAAGNPLDSLFTISSDEVLVESVKPGADGKSTLIRMFGVSGKDQLVTINWKASKRPVALWLTDLTERKLNKLEGPLKVPGYGVIHLRAEAP